MHITYACDIVTCRGLNGMTRKSAPHQGAKGMDDATRNGCMLEASLQLRARVRIGRRHIDGLQNEDYCNQVAISVFVGKHGLTQILEPSLRLAERTFCELEMLAGWDVSERSGDSQRNGKPSGLTGLTKII